MCLFISHLCVYMYFILAMGLFVYIYTCFLEFHTCIHVYFVGTGVVSFHYVSPIFHGWPFADAVYCTLCSVYFLLLSMILYISLGAPLACNDLLMY